MKELQLKAFENQNDGIDMFKFADRMEQHWTEELGNVSSKALRATWTQIAHTFNWHIRCHDNPEWAKRWSILSPPTGAGKTESTVIYAAMLADLPIDFHPGMLIVTRLKTDCDLIAQRINRFGSVETAVAYHTDADVKLTDLCQYPVVVITHRAYELALDFLGNEGRIEKTWPFFHRWWPNNRRLVVVDECLDIIDHHRICLEDIRQTLSAIPQDIRKRFPDDTMAIETVIGVLEQIDRKSKGITPQETMLLKAAVKQGELPDLTGLVGALGEIRFDRQIGKNDAMECERLRKRHEQRLRSLHYVFRSWCYYSKHSIDHSMNSARLLVPDGAKGCCVMDATASTNLVYELHQDSALIAPPEDSRSYRNFTLHVSRGHRVGKNHMVKDAKQLCSDLIRDLNGKLDGRKALVVCHKGVEPVLSKYDTTFDMQTGHWGAIDGSNHWKDCDTVVIFGLPYLPDTWSANVYMALQGPQDTEWLRSEGDRPFGDHIDIRKALVRGQLSTRIIQAINRIRCRKVVDVHGNCDNAEGYIMLPKGMIADAILDDIRKMMPGIRIVDDWKYTKQKKKAKASNHERALSKYIENLTTGRYASKRILTDIGMSAKTLKRLIARVKDPSTDLHQTMVKSGVEYVVEGKGQTQRAYFVKA